MSTGSLKTARKPTRAPPPPPLPPSCDREHYILISECSTGKRKTKLGIHQKSNSEYSYLPVEKSQITRNSAPSTPTDSKRDYILTEIDFPRTTALEECPSILNSNLANLSSESLNLLKCGADYLHLDVMDGQFVPNITFGHTMVKCLRRDLGKEPFFDVHMMVNKPLQWIEPMADAGCSQYTYHFETANDQPSVIRKIRESGMRVGLAIKPQTLVESILPFVDSVDMILVMTVEPGFGGQKFMPNMLSKIETLRKQFMHLDIEVDGGVGPATIGECCSAGANMIVSGTAITQAPDPKLVINQMKQIATASWRRFSEIDRNQTSY